MTYIFPPKSVETGNLITYDNIGNFGGNTIVAGRHQLDKKKISKPELTISSCKATRGKRCGPSV